MDIQKAVPLAPRTTFGLGGSAKHLAVAESLSDIQEAYAYARSNGLDVVVLGGGSNIVVPDEGLDCLVLKIATKGMRREGNTVVCAAGEKLIDLIRFAAGPHTNLVGVGAGLPPEVLRDMLAVDELDTPQQ